MGLFGKPKKEEHLSTCDYQEININHYAIARGTAMRKNQLTALFVLEKNKYPDAEYSIETTLKEFQIPEEFETTEIMALASFYEVKAWHIFIDEEHYIDIEMEFIKVNGELNMIDEVKTDMKKIESFKSGVDVHAFNFNKYAGWLWDKYLEQQYETCVKMGNRYLKYGDFYIYDDELDEYKITSKEDFDRIKRREYILLKSKLNEQRIVLIDTNLKQVLATELDDLEKEYLVDLLHPEVDDSSLA